MRASRRDMQAVVLVEEPDALRGTASDSGELEASSSGESSGPPRSRRGPTWLLRTRPAWTPIAAGLAIVVGTAGLFAAQHERERMAALADLAGILRPLDGPVTELWRTGSDAEGTYINGLAGFGGALLLTENSPDGQTDVVALDARTGRERWRVEARPAQDLTDVAGASTSGAGTNCAFPAADDRPGPSVVACVVTDETISVTSDNETIGETIVGTRAHLLVIDSTTGAVVSRAPIDPSSSVALAGPDLITGQFAADGRVQVSRSGARDGTLAWTFTSPEPISAEASGQRNVWVWSTEGFVGVSSYGGMGDDGRLVGGASWLLSADGVVVRHQITGAGENYTGLGVLPGGSTFVETTTTATGARASVLTDALTGRATTVEASPTGSSPDDGSLGDAILMQSEGGALLVYDLEAEQPRWTGATSADDGGRTIVLDGRVVRSGFDGSSTLDITSVDARTGKTIWSTSATSNQGGSLVTDGRVVVLARTSATRGDQAVLTAYDLADGRLRWEVPIEQEQWLIELDGGLFALAGSGLLVAYGEP